MESELFCEWEKLRNGNNEIINSIVIGMRNGGDGIMNLFTHLNCHLN